MDRTFAQELEQLNARIERTRGELAALEGELREAETEIEKLSVDNERFDALRDVCQALDKLGELDASGLFWEGVPGVTDTAAHLTLVRARIDRFGGGILEAHEKKDAIKARVDGCLDRLEDLREEVRQAYAREERRLEEYVVVREISPIPYRKLVMPWSNEGESESRYRRALLVALLLSIVLGYLVPLVNLPERDPLAEVELPKRLAMLVREEPPEPEPVPERPQEEKPEPEQPDKPEEVKEEPEKRPEPTPAETKKAREKAESSGILAFKESFADLMEDIPIAKLGAESLIDAGQTAGQAVASRSLITAARGSSSGGISTAAVSRNIGSGNVERLGGGVEFARVESGIADLTAEARPVSDTPGPARTDEEIQIVFDRYKATLYRIYNTELRRNPTLRGNIMLKITIEPDGSVSSVTVQSTDLDSPELVAQIVERVNRFNFGPKNDVPRTTILYPIDFLPAG